jgi:hypothetical protein
MDGTKTQTRRLKNLKEINANPDDWILYASNCCNSKGENVVVFLNEKIKERREIKCPYGQVGDRLWVKETWRIGAWDEINVRVCVDYKADNFSRKEWIKIPDTYPEDAFEKYWIESSDDAQAAGLSYDSDGNYHWKPGESPCRWRPSMFMPRWVSRITLEITNIRIERVQNISGEDCEAEGLVSLIGADDWDFATQAIREINLQLAYKDIWDCLNDKRGYPWAINPWVWVIEFKRIAP